MQVGGLSTGILQAPPARPASSSFDAVHYRGQALDDIQRLRGNPEGYSELRTSVEVLRATRPETGDSPSQATVKKDYRELYDSLRHTEIRAYRNVRSWNMEGLGPTPVPGEKVTVDGNKVTTVRPDGSRQTVDYDVNTGRSHVVETDRKGQVTETWREGSMITRKSGNPPKTVTYRIEDGKVVSA